MHCGKCDSPIAKCTCPDLNDRMRTVSDKGGFVANRWCAKCDSYYARCFCAEPEWMMRADGELSPLPA